MENSITIRGLIFLFIVIENSVTYKIIKNISNFVENIIVNSAVYSFFTADFDMFEKWRASYIGTGFYKICAFVWLKLTGLLDWIKRYSNYSIFVKVIRFPYSVIGKNAIRENSQTRFHRFKHTGEGGHRGGFSSHSGRCWHHPGASYCRGLGG